MAMGVLLIAGAKPKYIALISVMTIATVGAALVSGVPREETGSLMEKLIIPLIHFVLLGFLPVVRMRRSLHPAYGVGWEAAATTR